MLSTRLHWLVSYRNGIGRDYYLFVSLLLFIFILLLLMGLPSPWLRLWAPFSLAPNAHSMFTCIGANLSTTAAVATKSTTCGKHKSPITHDRYTLTGNSWVTPYEIKLRNELFLYSFNADIYLHVRVMSVDLIVVSPHAHAWTTCGLCPFCNFQPKIAYSFPNENKKLNLLQLIRKRYKARIFF